MLVKGCPFIVFPTLRIVLTEVSMVSLGRLRNIIPPARALVQLKIVFTSSTWFTLIPHSEAPLATIRPDPLALRVLQKIEKVQK